MSHSGRTPNRDSLNDRLKSTTLSSKDENKSDSRPRLDLGSPVSPLGARGAVPTTTSSSSSSSGSISTPSIGKVGNCTKSSTPPSVGRGRVSDSKERGRRNLSGDLSRGSSRTNSPKNVTASTAHKRSHSSSATSSGGDSSSVLRSSASSSPVSKVLPAGNICPSGKVVTTGMAVPATAKRDVLGSGSSNYGHGSVMRGTGNIGNLGGCNTSSSGGNKAKETIMQKNGACSSLHSEEARRFEASGSLGSEEIRKAGNEEYKKGHFLEALSLYDQAIAILPQDATCRSNRAAALMGLGRFHEAVNECEEAMRLSPRYERAQHRLGSLHLRLGQVQNARRHLCRHGQQPDPDELQKLQAVERHIRVCVDARMAGDWSNALREGDAAIAAGADFSPQLFACRAESFLKLQRLEDAESSLKSVPELGRYPTSCSQAKFFGILSEAYVLFVRAQVAMALGLFESAVVDAEKAELIDSNNKEVSMFLQKVRMVSRTRTRGNDHFKSGRYTEACAAYGEGLMLDPTNSVLFCNRAASWSRLEQWERSIEDCNEALRIQPNYTKALLRRATSSAKVEWWAQAVKDYGVLSKQLPNDIEVADALFHAEAALRKSDEEKGPSLQSGGEVQKISTLDKLKDILSSTGVVVVYFMEDSNEQCEEISPFVNNLCVRYPSIRFLKVDMEDSWDSRAVANAENVRVFPTFKIYKAGNTVKEMLRPTHQVLEHWVEHYKS
ncbi:hypothetical protein GIB67_001489 [Kingdonia uniflora]|uniref:Thioredoxin domain-containing protein n=1 Tax=Kingdonia uniflora TaxID=39325 RepID=A0A7J7MNI7_9MAGN|nr:hypothetical protein GIB67_001489 [Kingdonia uniflora]